MSSSKKQFFLHIDDEARTKKFLCIEMIFFHINHYAHQREEFNFVLRAFFIEIVVHNISDSILYQLLSFSIQTQFNELRQNRFIRFQRSFKHWKLLIFDEKFMINLCLLYKLNCRLRAIYTKSNRFFWWIEHHVVWWFCSIIIRWKYFNILSIAYFESWNVDRLDYLSSIWSIYLFYQINKTNWRFEYCSTISRNIKQNARRIYIFIQLTIFSDVIKKTFYFKKINQI
jgi:hypothetical protein